MNELGMSLIPLAAFWTVFNSLLKAAEFVNSIRDSRPIWNEKQRKAFY